jgi:AraC family transcriptional regulator
MDAQIVERGELLLVGMASHVPAAQAAQAIPAQWTAFSHYFGKIAGQVGQDAFGVVTRGDAAGNMDYMSAVQVVSFDACPPELARLVVPAARYAEFPHDGPVWEIRKTWDKALQACSGKMADGPIMERYQPTFNPNTGLGGMSLLVPIT